MKKKICFFSFLLPFLSMMAIFIGNGIYPFGDQSFMHSDMYHQYVPFLEEFVRKVRDGEPLYYSWRIGMGSNYLSLYGYYSASPFNWLMLLLPEKYLIEFMSYMVVFKIGLCGFTFSWLLTEKFHTNDLSVLFFSTFYAMSGFVAAYNWNVMWMDTLVLAPLIVLGLEKLVFEKKYSLYCITLGLCILSNYYLSIMVCIFLCLYFLVLVPNLFGSDGWKAFRARLLGAIGRFALFSLLAGGLAAVLLTSSGELKALILIGAVFVVSMIGFRLIFSKQEKPAEDAKQEPQPANAEPATQPEQSADPKPAEAPEADAPKEEPHGEN